MKCPTCGSKLKVVDVRPRSDTLIKRRLECRNKACKARVTSWEEIEASKRITTGCVVKS